MNKIKGFLFSLALTLAAMIAPAISADFAYHSGAITMTGEIQPGDFVDKFLPLVTAHVGEVKFIILKNSPGGAAIDAMLVGDYVFNAGIATVDSGYCMSGCGFIWLSGTSKMFDEATADKDTIAVHMPYSIAWTGAAVPAPPEIVKLVQEFLMEVGVSDALAADILATPGGPTTALYLTSDKFADWGLKVIPYGR